VNSAVLRFIHFMSLMLVGLVAAAPAVAVDTGAVQRDHIEVELIAETMSVQPGAPFRVGLRLLPDPGWHTYWKNPGDSGIPTEIEWDLPAGASASPIVWPYPGAMPMGHLINYGYKGEHLLPVTLEVPEDLSVGDDFIVRAETSWLVCEEICIPGDAELQLTLPVVDEPPSINEAARDLFAWADQRRPSPVDWPARFNTEGGQLSLQIEPSGVASQTEWAFFSALANVVDHSRPASATAGNGRIFVAQKLSPYLASTPESLPFVLVDTVNERAFELTAQAGDLVSVGTSTAAATPGWLVALGLALIGGVLLNLMPCVFPVLSIKAISLVSGAGKDQRPHGLAYTAGVLVSFAALAAVLLLLRAGGEAIGWGFQLQSPLVIGILIYVLFALGLSLSGLFDFGTRLMGVGQSLTDQGGLSGSFFTGILACVVASPCTAPFMGTALGAAILMPWPMAMAVFLALGLGLALPMLLLSFSPALARRLPRPGPWMETFKQAMAFPLYLAVVWLIWVLARQTDANGLAAVLIGLVALAFTLWLFGKRDSGPVMSVARHVSVFAGLVIALAALAAAARFESGPAEVADAWWEDYSAARLAELRADPDTAVFVNMTADWCLTCKVNEGVALNKAEVRAAFEAESVVYMKGDWTRRDAAITDYLAQFGRNGVPLYVVYPRNGGEPRILPQVLTPGLVVSAVEAL
jgi:thiol:disulfide interchange protein DsbD